MMFIKKSKQSAHEKTNEVGAERKSDVPCKRQQKDEDSQQGQPVKKKPKLEMKLEPRKLSISSCSDVSVSQIRFYS